MKKKYSSKLNNYLLYIFTVIICTGSFIKSQERVFFFLESNQVSSVYAASNLSRIETQRLSTQEELEYEAISNKLEMMDVDQVKVRKVRSYLAARGAPLASKAEYLVKTAQQFGIDYRLVAAISIIESSGGKYPYKPYNAWGWGGSVIPFSFKSWEEGIYTVTRGLSRYYSSGLVTPRQIAPRYNPHTPNEWSRKVEYVMSQM
ncbi:hypothetical protein HYV12_02340 [Candidatus Dojkabacteria bacterium]|nr:hypothetical protein [Candidatus Dojkabacteria bacterium]